jgi:hypothetical protein
MGTVPEPSLCGHLRAIIAGMEQGDRESAATAAAEMMRWIESAPAVASDDELAEAKGLLERYAALGDKLRQETVEAMNRLGNVRRLSAYGAGGRQP